MIVAGAVAASLCAAGGGGFLIGWILGMFGSDELVREARAARRQIRAQLRHKDEAPVPTADGLIQARLDVLRAMPADQPEAQKVAFFVAEEQLSGAKIGENCLDGGHLLKGRLVVAHRDKKTVESSHFFATVRRVTRGSSVAGVAYGPASPLASDGAS